jgi:hypothetical protein
MIEVIKVRCTKDIVNINRGGFRIAFRKGKQYELYVEDNWRSIWGFNEVGNDQMLRDFETPDS